MDHDLLGGLRRHVTLDSDQWRVVASLLMGHCTRLADRLQRQVAEAPEGDDCWAETAEQLTQASSALRAVLGWRPGAGR